MKNPNNDQMVLLGESPRETIWSDGKVKLYHFVNSKPAATATPTLIIYSLVNKWYMLDLQEDRSFIRKMIDMGLDLYLLDTGDPSVSDKYKSMEDYICGNIYDAVTELCKFHGVPNVNLMGVCQGGTMSIIFAALYPAKVKNLVTLITPVDFSSSKSLLFEWSKNINIGDIVKAHHYLIPGKFLEHAFKWLKPAAQFRKYMNIPTAVADRETLMNFLRMELWISLSPPQAGLAYRQFVEELYIHNKLIQGKLKINGRKVLLSNIRMPLLNVYAKHDHIVPPESSIPLCARIASSDTETISFDAGHIGIFVGRKSQTELAPRIASWILKRDVINTIT